MPVTLTYDFTSANPNDRTYIRSMFERFNWKRIGGSVFRYSGRIVNTVTEEDWLNDVVPALMFFRAYIIKNQMQLSTFTLDTNSISLVDHTDQNFLLGQVPLDSQALQNQFVNPTNTQSSIQTICNFINDGINAI